MSKFLRLKKSNCKNCYKCIRHCPVKSIRFTANRPHVIGDECILCGQCVVICPQGAKEIMDGTEAVKVLLSGNAPVYASIAPSFIANYGVGIESMQKALSALGFAGAEETAIGATMVKNEYERILREHECDVLISSCCHSVNLLVRKHFPQLIPMLAGVKSPMLAHCADIKRRIPGAKTVFIGPCVAKKDEGEESDAVDAVLTFEELNSLLEERSITLEQSRESCDESRARLFPTVGGVLKTMRNLPADYRYMAVDGTENCIAVLRELASGNLHQCFIEMSACVGSCVRGPVMDKTRQMPVHNYLEVSSYAGERDFAIEQPTPDALARRFLPVTGVREEPGESEIVAILRQMGKTRPEDELNCGSCGYDTCREKAIAIYRGKADISMCLPYLKERAEMLSDNIIKNSPNGILVLNENFEVQSINRSALRILNLRTASDVLGEPVVRILDPTIFTEVKNSGKSVKGRRTYLAEYQRYVEETVSYDKDYHILICTMRDVTDEEIAKEKKEAISRHTMETADRVVEKQMRIVQEIASLLGETAAETKIALTKLKESIADE
ncbi:MAG: 4Fe-4S binding protein [Clostridia bacterium]|nr:4Fe-4S binding protein [Clostridia bacterium]